MQTEGIDVVLGATGGTGNALVRTLHDRGHRVRAVSRKGDADVPDGVERAAGDVTNLDDLKRVLQGATIVYHCAQPPYTAWEREFPSMNRTILAAAEHAEAKLVFADNLYMYDPSLGPINEATPETAPGERSRLRAAMADELLAAHREGHVRVSIGRSSDYYGPGGLNSTLGNRLFEAVLAGEKVQWMGSLDVPHTCSYLPDMGRGLASLGEQERADGRAWILPAAPPITGRAFIASAAEAAGTSPRPTVVSNAMVRIAGVFVPMIRAVGKTMYQWTTSFTVDAGAFQQAFGPFEPTPHAEAIAATVVWFRDRARGSATAPAS